ncbi:hypothetical protein [Planomonospora sp. ID82291]|uniref:hypothetical protein n=1 Tax=Planomonospora sp. ID82291 TaxID=2738136 RepID=UPI0018C407ED|nr:hypothetical protein [Planomonospora sp. ID82291]MBG0818359.1 hypothetical protein [Planomonospora sp. ID82291]
MTGFTVDVMSGAGETDPQSMDVAACARLLHRSSWQVRRAIRSGAFTPPVGRDSRNRPYWHRAQVYAWAAVDPGLRDRVPVRYWPQATRPAHYLGAETIPGGVTALGWDTGAGTVWVLWPELFDALTYPAELVGAAEHLADAAAIVMVGGDYGADGPSVYGVVPADLEQTYEVAWSTLSQVLGMPMPFWPPGLRIGELLTSWHPGSVPVVAAAVPDLDPAPLLRLAVIVDHGGPAQQTLMNLVQTWHYRVAEHAESHLKLIGEWTTPATTVVAATPLAVPAVEHDDLPDDVRRAGWLEILARTDALAIACVRQVLRWNGGQDFPFSMIEAIDPATSLGGQWAQRLVPASRSAVFELLDPRQEAADLLFDPVTDAPAIRVKRRRRIELLAAIPQRLPATSPLTELILDEPVWVRTGDGTLYPAPQTSPYGPAWGYRGAGPSTLALLVNRLLDDINAAAPGRLTAAVPKGLLELAQRSWAKGTVLTRAQLEAAQDGRPYLESS